MHVGIDVGGTKALAVLVEPQGEADAPLVRARRRIATPTQPDALAPALAELARAVAADGGGIPESLGVGIAGLIDRAGTVRYSPHLPGVIDHPLARLLGEQLGFTVAVDNDLSTAALAEARYGAGRGARDVVVVGLGTGIGAKLVSGGHLVLGAHGFAGEAGHMTVNRHGARHVSGVPGAWERYASGTALGRLMRTAARRGEAPDLVARAGSPRTVSAEHIQASVDAGDARTLAVLDRFADEVAAGVGNLVDVLDPDLVVLAGGVRTLGEPLRARVEARVSRFVVGAAHRPAVPVALAALGDEAGAVGAAVRGIEVKLANDPRLDHRGG